MTTVTLRGGASLTLELYPVLNRKDSAGAAVAHEAPDEEAELRTCAERIVLHDHRCRAPLDGDRGCAHLELEAWDDAVPTVGGGGAGRAEDNQVSRAVDWSECAGCSRNRTKGPHLPCTIMRCVRQDEVPWRILISWMSVFRQLFVCVVRGRNAVAELVGRGPDNHLLLLGGGC